MSFLSETFDTGAESIDSYQTDNSETSEESDLDYGVNNSVPYLYCKF